jgi:hypothetical protein
MNSSKGSQFIRFFKPIIEVLKETGGSGTAAEVIDRVIEKMRIPESALKGGQLRRFWGYLRSFAALRMTKFKLH